MPVGIAPAALHGLAHPDGELATVRAAAAAGAIAVVSTVASHSLEAVAAAAPDARRWFQLYDQRDPGVSRALVERAAAAGYEALVLTVDAPVLGYRDELLRLPFDPGADAYANLPKRDVWRAGAELDEIIDMRGVPLDVGPARRDPLLGAVAARCSRAFLTPEDARIAVDHGVDAVRAQQPRRPPSSTGQRAPSTCCRRSWTPSRAAPRSTSTAGSAAAPTC